MELFTPLLITHIIAGALGLLVGSIVMVLKKGNKTHKTLGRVFSYSMLYAGVSSLILAIMHPNTFLFMVGVFSVYLVATGHRYLYLKERIKNHKKAQVLDWLLSSFMLVFALGFIIYGILVLRTGNMFSLVLIVFGGLGCLFVKQDYLYYRAKVTDMLYWLRIHIGRMMGAYISALTAFLVNNSRYFPDYIPGFIFWLLPTLLFVPLILKWIKRYCKTN